MAAFSSSEKNPTGAKGPVAVGSFVTRLAGPALSRGETVIGELISRWAAIAGPALAAHTIPSKITKIPAKPGTPAQTASSRLVLQVAPAKALEVQYAIPQIIDRINATLGFKAVSEVRLLQIPLSEHARLAREPIKPEKDLARAATTGGRRLDAALARLSDGLSRRLSP